MKTTYEIIIWGIFAMLAAVLVRLILVEIDCDEIVKKHIGDRIPRSIDVNPSGDFLTGECSFKMISNSIKVS